MNVMPMSRGAEGWVLTGVGAGLCSRRRLHRAARYLRVRARARAATFGQIAALGGAGAGRHGGSSVERVYGLPLALRFGRSEVVTPLCPARKPDGAHVKKASERRAMQFNSTRGP